MNFRIWHLKCRFEQKAITDKQFKIIAELSSDGQTLTGAWIKSDKKTFKAFAPIEPKE